jgi:hypothetical protein
MRYQRVKGACCFRLSISWKKAVDFSETLVHIYQVTRRHNPEDSNISLSCSQESAKELDGVTSRSLVIFI